MDSSHVDVEKSMHPQRVTAWYGFWHDASSAHFFFFENEEEASEVKTTKDIWFQ